LGDFSIADGETVEKRFAHDLIPDLLSTGGLARGKVEGLAVDGDGNVWVSSDNGGIDHSSGEQLLLNVGPLNYHVPDALYFEQGLLINNV
jgi:sugar lactone lactonase YvrE